MSKKVVLVDGGKGGVGKSTVAAVIIDRLLADGHSPLVVEADGSVPDVAPRFDGRTRLVMAPLSRGDATEDRVLDVFGRIMDSPDELVVVNLPSGAGETLNEHADLIAAAVEDAGGELVHVWVVGAAQASAELAADSIAAGIAAVAHRLVAVVNAHGGDDVDRYPWIHSEARGAWIDAGAAEIVLPRLPAAVRGAVPSGYRDALPSLNAIQRASLRRWLAAADPIVDAVMGHGQ